MRAAEEMALIRNQWGIFRYLSEVFTEPSPIKGQPEGSISTMISTAVLASLLAVVQALPASDMLVEVSPRYAYSQFTFPPNAAPTYAKGLPKPSTVTNYGPHYTEVSHLLGDLKTTTWGNWNPNATATATDKDDPYGQYAWSQLWENVALKNFTSTGIYSTTVDPTPVPSESLVLPPPDVFSFDDNLKFPLDFVFGVAGSAAQIEGAIAMEGRSPTIIEVLVRYSRPKDYVTNENYYLYKQDLLRLAQMGVKTYSFSIPWTRILPFVTPGTPVNKQGIDHYDDLINYCLELGIQPMVTLTHFDSPVQFLGGKVPLATDYPLNFYAGYANDTFVEAFVNYGKIVMSHFADRVGLFVTFNEPYLYAGYPLGVKNVVTAHAALYDFYHNELKGCGKVGIKFNDNFGVPKNATDPQDVAAANRFQDFQLGSFANPLFLGQDYPEAWKSTFSNETEIFFSAEELKNVSKKVDFLGIDPYTYTVVTPPEEGIAACQANTSHSLWPLCVNETQTREDGWKMGYRSESYVYTTPVEFRQYLNYLWNTFKAPVFVTEYGFPEWKETEKELGDQLFDQARSIYYRLYLDAMLKAIHEDKVEVMGSLAWSFQDNWEFGSADQLFGMQVVNTTTQERFFKKSFFDYVKFYQDRI